MTEDAQLAALDQVLRLLEREQIESWLFGGWAVDFHAGRATRPHADLDLAVWKDDLEHIATLLEAAGWSTAPEPGEDGYTGFERQAVRLELAFLARLEDGRVVTPLSVGFEPWPENSFGSEVGELAGVRARVIGLGALREDKATVKTDPVTAAKDRDDLAVLKRLGR
jgi:hypothetical protein